VAIWVAMMLLGVVGREQKHPFRMLKQRVVLWNKLYVVLRHEANFTIEVALQPARL